MYLHNLFIYNMNMQNAEWYSERILSVTHILHIESTLYGIA